MDSKTRKFLRFEKISSYILITCLASSLIAVAVALILKNLALENSVVYTVAGTVAVVCAILSFPIGFWIAGRPRYCPKCNTEMESVGERSTLVFRCPACSFEFDTRMDNVTGG